MSSIRRFMQKKSEIIDKIASSITTDGGAIGTLNATADPLTTSEMLYCLNKIKAPKNVKMAEWLVNAQDISGKWTTYIEDSWEVSITSWAIIALSSVYPKNTPTILRAIKWLISRQGKDGGFAQSDAIDIENTYATSYACFALHCVDSQRYRDVISRGIIWLISAQNQDGGFGLQLDDPSESSLTAYVAHFIGEISSCYCDLEQMREKIVMYLLNTQRVSGAWTAWFEPCNSIEGTAFSLIALMSLSRIDVDVINKACSYLNSAIDLRNIDNWICSSLLLLIDRLETAFGD